jgi:hypothetical protein
MVRQREWLSPHGATKLYMRTVGEVAIEAKAADVVDGSSGPSAPSRSLAGFLGTSKVVLPCPATLGRRGKSQSRRLTREVARSRCQVRMSREAAKTLRKPIKHKRRPNSNLEGT